MFVFFFFHVVFVIYHHGAFTAAVYLCVFHIVPTDLQSVYFLPSLTAGRLAGSWWQLLLFVWSQLVSPPLQPWQQHIAPVPEIATEMRFRNCRGRWKTSKWQRRIRRLQKLSFKVLSNYFQTGLGGRSHASYQTLWEDGRCFYAKCSIDLQPVILRG